MRALLRFPRLAVSCTHTACSALTARNFSRPLALSAIRGGAMSVNLAPTDSPFTAQETEIMLALLRENAPVPAHEPDATRRRDHVTYCFAQMLRFCHLASTGVEPFRQAQFGLALGRVQELLGCVGGKAAWWSAFEPLLLATDYGAISARTRAYLDLLGLPQPDEAFLNKR